MFFEPEVQGSKKRCEIQFVGHLLLDPLKLKEFFSFASPRNNLADELYLLQLVYAPTTSQEIGYICVFSHCATDFKIASEEMSTTGTIIFSFVSIVGSNFGIGA